MFIISFGNFCTIEISFSPVFPCTSVDKLIVKWLPIYFFYFSTVSLLWYALETALWVFPYHQDFHKQPNITLLSCFCFLKWDQASTCVLMPQPLNSVYKWCICICMFRQSQLDKNLSSKFCTVHHLFSLICVYFKVVLLFYFGIFVNLYDTDSSFYYILGLSIVVTIQFLTSGSVGLASLAEI